MKLDWIRESRGSVSEVRLAHARASFLSSSGTRQPEPLSTGLAGHDSAAVHPNVWYRLSGVSCIDAKHN